MFSNETKTKKGIEMKWSKQKRQCQNKGPHNIITEYKPDNKLFRPFLYNS